MRVSRPVLRGPVGAIPVGYSPMNSEWVILHQVEHLMGSWGS